MKIKVNTRQMGKWRIERAKLWLDLLSSAMPEKGPVFGLLEAWPPGVNKHVQKVAAVIWERSSWESCSNDDLWVFRFSDQAGFILRV